MYYDTNSTNSRKRPFRSVSAPECSHAVNVSWEFLSALVQQTVKCVFDEVWKATRKDVSGATDGGQGTNARMTHLGVIIGQGLGLGQ